jgi:dephospho-CoA kinase
MLRVGLTGGLGSGKSVVAAYLHSQGAEVIQADEMGRVLMEPGQAVYEEIVRQFGNEITHRDGSLNRARLAELAFQGNRLQALNAIVHPAVIAAQRQWMEVVFDINPRAVAVVESALIFEVERDARKRGEMETVLADWRQRFDRILVVTAPYELKISRHVARSCAKGMGREEAEADARARMEHQIPDAEKASHADYVIDNSGDMDGLRAQAKDVWRRIKGENDLFAADELVE